MKIKYAVLLGIIIIAACAVIGCGGGTAQAARDGDTVYVHYTGTLDDGSVFDSSRERGPLEFVLGAGNMISGFENAVRGMKVGDSKTVTLAPGEAYGEYREDLVMTFSREKMPEGMEVELGQQLTLQSNTGVFITATVIDISEENITVDANHRLAGKTLTFEIELMKIKSAQ
jgi:peptidylprolyl isomerase